jgi:sulfite exporter TauE/SafE
MTTSFFDIFAMYCGYSVMGIATVLVTGLGTHLAVIAWNEYIQAVASTMKNTYWFLVFRRVQRRMKLRAKNRG